MSNCAPCTHKRAHAHTQGKGATNKGEQMKENRWDLVCDELTQDGCDLRAKPRPDLGTNRPFQLGGEGKPVLTRCQRCLAHRAARWPCCVVVCHTLAQLTQSCTSAASSSDAILWVQGCGCNVSVKDWIRAQGGMMQQGVHIRSRGEGQGSGAYEGLGCRIYAATYRHIDIYSLGSRLDCTHATTRQMHTQIVHAQVQAMEKRFGHDLPLLAHVS